MFRLVPAAFTPAPERIDPEFAMHCMHDHGLSPKGSQPAVNEASRHAKFNRAGGRRAFQRPARQRQIPLA